MVLTMMTCRGGSVTATVDTSCFRGRGKEGMEDTLRYHVLRSGPPIEHQLHHHHTMEDTDRDPVLAELSDGEILEALNIIEKVRKNQEDTEVLTDEEVIPV